MAKQKEHKAVPPGASRTLADEIPINAKYKSKVYKQEK